MSRQNSPMSERQRMWRLAGRYSSIGVEMAVCIGGASWLGHYADKQFDTKPWLFFFGVVVGVGAATKAVVRVAKHFRASTLSPDQTSDDESGSGPSA